MFRGTKCSIRASIKGRFVQFNRFGFEWCDVVAIEPDGLCIYRSGSGDGEPHSLCTCYRIESHRLVRIDTYDVRGCDGRVTTYLKADWTGGFRFHVWRNYYWQRIGPGNWPHFVIGLRWREVDADRRDYAAEAAGY